MADGDFKALLWRTASDKILCDKSLNIAQNLKYVWVVPLKDKKGITITLAFQKILDDSGCKLNKISVDKGSERCNKAMKSVMHTR